MPYGARVALDSGVLLRLAGLDVLDGDAQTPRPDQQLGTDAVRAVVDSYTAGLAAPFDMEGNRFPDDGSRLRRTRSAGREGATSMPKPSRLTVSSTFSNQNARPSPSRSAMKSPCCA